MANRIQQKIRKLEFIRDNLQSEANKIVKKYERDIVRLNINQMIDGIGSDGKELFNVLPQFTGTYRRGYKKSGLYNFFETGQFIRGMFAEVNGNDIKIDSRGKGNGEKSLFINSYTNLFGLDDYSRKLFRDKIMPELRVYLKSKL